MFPPFLRPLAWVTTGLAVVAVVVTATARPRPPEVSTAPLPTVRQPAPSTEENNPVVLPGLVRWHPSFADAQAAAQRSGKPVLLLHMMGQLDRQFC